MEIVRINDDGTEGERFTTEKSEPDANTTPTAAWPFGDKEE
jgi:hypothetical protein